MDEFRPGAPDRSSDPPPTHPVGRPIFPIGCCALNGTAILFFDVCVLLVVLVGGWWDRRQQESRKRACLSQIALVRVSLDSYQSSHGAYPPPPNAAVMAALRGSGPAELSATGEYLDPWGRPFVFRPFGAGAVPPKGPPYLIYSVGRNGKDEMGGGDDITPPR